MNENRALYIYKLVIKAAIFLLIALYLSYLHFQRIRSIYITLDIIWWLYLQITIACSFCIVVIQSISWYLYEAFVSEIIGRILIGKICWGTCDFFFPIIGLENDLWIFRSCFIFCKCNWSCERICVVF